MMKKLTILLLLLIVFAFALWDVDPDYSTLTADTVYAGKVVVTDDATFEDTVDLRGARINAINYNSIQPTCIACFQFDDGNTSHYTKLKPLFDTENIVGGLAIYTDAVGNAGIMTWTQINEMYGDGWEILNHTHTHVDLTTISTDSVKAEFERADSCFIIHNIISKSAVYPSHAYNDTVVTVSEQYFRAVRGSSGINVYPLRHLYLKSIQIDNHVNLATYKLQVDSADNENKLIIFHAHAVNDEDVDSIGLLIDYIQGKNIPIMTLDQALDSLENRIQIGNFFEMGLDGKFVSGSHTIVKKGDVPNDTALTIHWTDTSATPQKVPAFSIKMDATTASPTNTQVIGITITGTAFDNYNDYWLYLNTTNYWSVTGLHVNPIYTNMLYSDIDDNLFLRNANNRDTQIYWSNTKKGDVIFRDGNLDVANIDFIQVQDSNSVVKLAIPNDDIRGQATFTAVCLIDTVEVAGVTTNSFVFLTVKSTTTPTSDLSWAYLNTDSITVHCLAADTALLRVNPYCWFRIE
jgi:peptidoglycan/xylan/chitin deacetylase (PgdA/CDA1 family)